MMIKPTLLAKVIAIMKSKNTTNTRRKDCVVSPSSSNSNLFFISRGGKVVNAIEALPNSPRQNHLIKHYLDKAKQALTKNLSVFTELLKDYKEHRLTLIFKHLLSQKLACWLTKRRNKSLFFTKHA